MLRGSQRHAERPHEIDEADRAHGFTSSIMTSNGLPPPLSRKPMKNLIPRRV
jgi:hypothetical protein